MPRWRAGGGGLGWEVVAAVLTIAKMHGESVAYYESTVDAEWAVSAGPDGYYSEDGSSPARAWVAARSSEQTARVVATLGVEVGARVKGAGVRGWFNKALAPSGVKLGRVPGVPGFDLTFCAPKSVSIIWGLTEDAAVRRAVDAAHARAVESALGYLAEHAGYTRCADGVDRSVMVVDRLEALTGVRYEHRTSRAGDPHVHSHVLLANKQLCADGKWRTVDGVGLFHEARAAGTIYQAVLREELSARLGVRWADTVNGCAEIKGLDNRALIKKFSMRMSEIDQWRRDNKLAPGNVAARLGQKKTRQTKDLDTSLSELEATWRIKAGEVTWSLGTKNAGGFIDKLSTDSPAAHPGVTREVVLPSPEEIVTAATAQRSTFTRADLVEATAELIPVGAVAPGEVAAAVEHLVGEALANGSAWSVTPEKSRVIDPTAREGSQRYTSEPVVAEVERGIELATKEVHRGVSAAEIVPATGELSESQADAMRAVVESRYTASVLIAPAGAGKTSSLKAARRVWEKAGFTVVGLAPTGKAADVMAGEEVAHETSTIARALKKMDRSGTFELSHPLGWGPDTVVVVDEAGMVGTPEMVRLLTLADQAGARIVFVGDPHQYSPVKARGGMLSTLARELPDTAELGEVFRQRDPAEREASTRLRTGEAPDVSRAADFYRDAGRLHAGSVTAMLDDALAGWKDDVAAGAQSLLVASSHDYVDALNTAAQAHMAARGVLDTARHTRIVEGHVAYVGETVLTRRNDYQLVTDAGDVVRNGQRWQVETIHTGGDITVRRLDDTRARVRLGMDYVREHVQLGYASTGHAAQGATVDVARVVAGAGQVDAAGVYVPMTRGCEANYLYLAEAMPGDTETGHGDITPTVRRKTADYARDLLVQAATRDRGDVTPHEVHRQTRLDWTISRISQNLPVGADPFAGTRMAEVATARSRARLERLERFHNTEAQLLSRAPAPETARSPRARDFERDGTWEGLNHGEKITRLDTTAAELKDTLDGLTIQRDHTRKEIQNLESEHAEKIRAAQEVERRRQKLIDQRDNRGLFKRLFNPDEGVAEIRACEERAGELVRNTRELEETLDRAREQLTTITGNIGKTERALKRNHSHRSLIEIEAHCADVLASGALRHSRTTANPEDQNTHTHTHDDTAERHWGLGM